MVRRAATNWDCRYTTPMVMYFHTWELDPDQPRIHAAPWHTRIRQYRNLDRVEPNLRYYFENFRFTGVADCLGLSTGPLRVRPPVPPAAREIPPILPPAPANAERKAVTIVVPCYNEELILPYLANTLQSVQAQMGAAYQLRFIFVDDCSTDDTWAALHRVFGGRPDCAFVRQEKNRGVAAAIMAGIRTARTEIVCSIDCDCTYDPHQLAEMIPLLGDGDLVTASPYHPDGVVRNVPGWRLVLSQRLSAAYRTVLGQRYHTWTSCFRVYRRESALALRLTRGGFLGVAEMMALLLLNGRTVVEYPATLEVRMLGRSKMKVLRTILGHMRLLGHLTLVRLGVRPDSRPDVSTGLDQAGTSSGTGVEAVSSPR
jgi:hypothetical protein